MGLICSNIEVNYPEFTLKLDLKVEKGELVSIVGPSGCGKSTSLQLITGLIPCTKGSITLNGQLINDKPVWERNIGMVFQDYALFPHLNVEKNIAYSLRFKKLSKKERKEKVKQMLALVGLQGYEKRKIGLLSGGERQRVALARALASEPQLLLLDEPLSALDAKMRKHLRQEIKKIHSATGITTLYVTHDQEEALTISDRIVVMEEGKMVQFDTAEEIYTNPATLFAAQFMGEGTLLPSSMIEKALVINENKRPDFLAKESYDIFFRPEDVVLQTNFSLPMAEYKNHLLFEDVKIVAQEYQGGRYLLRCEWNSYPLLAYSSSKIETDNINLSIRLEDIKIYQ
jgi:ABC-type Fe3+/spermidine/putrescine transport system ATPase subunit